MHTIKKMIRERENGRQLGIYSACTASRAVIEAVVAHAAAQTDSPVCVEATANQVDQYGGYTGMKPRDFAALVHEIADDAGLPRERVILGGDHLGPLTFRSDEPAEALKKAAVLVAEYVRAGFDKIHIDTSMSLRGDNILTDELIAERAAALIMAAEKAAEQAGVLPPVYIIGSEVPIPGGALEDEDEIGVTKPESFVSTVEAFRREFDRNGLSDVWDRVVGVVVQPGVEFSDAKIHEYNHEKASALTACLKNYPGIVFEGHSTDYQTTASLREMVEDGIAILKVGPGLTFAQRECMFALSYIEKELLGGDASDFIAALDRAMLDNPANWAKHYSGNERELAFKRKYSFADRCRYYLSNESVKAAAAVMYSNLERTGIPLSLLSQYLPKQYRKVRERALEALPGPIIRDYITQECIELYTAAFDYRK